MEAFHTIIVAATVTVLFGAPVTVVALLTRFLVRRELARAPRACSADKAPASLTNFKS